MLGFCAEDASLLYWDVLVIEWFLSKRERGLRQGDLLSLLLFCYGVG